MPSSRHLNPSLISGSRQRSRTCGGAGKCDWAAAGGCGGSGWACARPCRRLECLSALPRLTIAGTAARSPPPPRWPCAQSSCLPRAY
eukprot:scaffold7307_cov125-Isochrysis_galbana.AAC.7